MRAAAAGVLALVAIAPAHGVRDRSQENQGNYTPEEELKELKVPPPTWPQDRNLIEVSVTPASRNRFFVDGSTLTVGEDRIVRFVLVIQSSQGARNVSFSGVRCKSREWKDYAFGTRDQTWRVDETREWRLIEDVNQNNYKFTLYKEFFCDGGLLNAKPSSSELIVRNLKNPPMWDHNSPRKYNSSGATVY